MFPDCQRLAENHHPWWNRATGASQIAVSPRRRATLNLLKIK